MIAPGITPQARRALELAIISAFFQPGSAAHIATAFSTGGKVLHAADVQRIWDAAKESGELPKINRPAGGPKERTREGGTMTETKKPFWVECSKCTHQWPAAYLPMEVSTFAKAAKAICPMCGSGPKGILIAKQKDGVLTEPAASP